MAGHPRSVREAYYEAVMELGVARDTLQIRIGEYLASAKDVRATLEKRAPTRMIERFDELAALTTKHLIDDLVGEGPDG